MRHILTKDEVIEKAWYVNDSYHNVVMKGESVIIDDKWYESADDEDIFYNDLEYVYYAGGLWVEE